jgi:hypothetical protein
MCWSEFSREGFREANMATSNQKRGDILRRMLKTPRQAGKPVGRVKRNPARDQGPKPKKKR